MFHLIVGIFCIIILFISHKFSFLSNTVQISLFIVSFIAFIRYMIERDIRQLKGILARAKEIENQDRKKANVKVGECIFIFQENHHMLPEFYDFLIKFDDGSEYILSTSKLDIIEKIKNEEGKSKYYYLDGFIIDVEDLSKSTIP